MSGAPARGIQPPSLTLNILRGGQHKSGGKTPVAEDSGCQEDISWADSNWKLDPKRCDSRPGAGFGRYDASGSICDRVRGGDKMGIRLWRCGGDCWNERFLRTGSLVYHVISSSNYKHSITLHESIYSNGIKPGHFSPQRLPPWILFQTCFVP